MFFQLNLDITVDPLHDLRLRLKGYDLRSGLLKGAERSHCGTLSL